MTAAAYCISRSESFEIRSGEFGVYYPKGQRETCMSIQPDGTIETRPANAAGAWETWKPSKDGNRAIFYETSEVFAFPLVD